MANTEGFFAEKDSPAGFPLLMAYSYRYPDYIEGLYAVTIAKDLYPERENLSFDGNTYAGNRSGSCTLSFVNDISDRMLIGDYIYIIRAQPTGGGLGAEGIWKMIANFRQFNLVDLRGTVIFQGIVTSQGWSQTVGAGWDNFQQIYEVTLTDLTTFLNDADLFGRDIMEGKTSPSLHFDSILKKHYDIDVRKRYRRGELVDKLVTNYLKGGRVSKRGTGAAEILTGGWAQRMIGQGSSQSLGIQFDGSTRALDWVWAEEVFRGRNPNVSLWSYLTRLSSPPLYECFIREDNGLLVFRRAAWMTVGSVASKYANLISGGAVNNSRLLATIDNQALKQRDSSRFWPLSADLISHVKLQKTSAGLSNIIMLARDGDRLKNSRLNQVYIDRYGTKFSGSKIGLYDPELTFRSNDFLDALGQGAAGVLKSSVGAATAGIPWGRNLFYDGIKDINEAARRAMFMEEYRPINVQNDILRSNVADIWRGTVSLRMWLPISIGDHVKLSESVPADFPRDFWEKWDVGFKGNTARADDFIYYVTAKNYHARVAENGQFTETLQLRLNYGGLEFADPLSKLGVKIENK